MAHSQLARTCTRCQLHFSHLLGQDLRRRSLKTERTLSGPPQLHPPTGGRRSAGSMMTQANCVVAKPPGGRAPMDARRGGDWRAIAADSSGHPRSSGRFTRGARQATPMRRPSAIVAGRLVHRRRCRRAAWAKYRLESAHRPLILARSRNGQMPTSNLQ